MNKQVNQKRWMLAPLTVVVLLVSFILLKNWGHIVSTDREEIARRTQCRVNLRNVARIIKQREIELIVLNEDKLNALIAETGLWCDSDRHKMLNNASSYRTAVSEDNTFVITEDWENHKPTATCKLPWVRFVLDKSLQVREENKK